jgi:predicted nucleic acid-binding protein
MTRVFADTFYFLALLNKHDEAHAKALAYSSLIDKLVTTEWVLTELADGLAASRHRKMFVHTREELLADNDAQSLRSTDNSTRKASASFMTATTRNGR